MHFPFPSAGGGGEGGGEGFGPSNPGPGLSALFGPTLLQHSGAGNVSVSTATALAGTRVVGIYHSASWCPPCRQFTPILATIFRQALSAGRSFQIVFCSQDRSPAEFEEYFRHMPWLALPFNGPRSALSSAFRVSGIPSLSLVNDSGGVYTNFINAVPSIRARPNHFLASIPFPPPQKPIVTPGTSPSGAPLKGSTTTQQQTTTSNVAPASIGKMEKAGDQVGQEDPESYLPIKEAYKNASPEEFIVNLQENEALSAEKKMECLKCVRTILYNIAHEPRVQRFRNLKKSNKIIQSKLGADPALLGLLFAVGFRETETEYVFPQTASLDLLKETLKLLKAIFESLESPRQAGGAKEGEAGAKDKAARVVEGSDETACGSSPQMPGQEKYVCEGDVCRRVDA